MRLIVLDFESRYDDGYSLKKMTTHEYIRDSRWKCLGCGFQIDGGDPFYLTDPEPMFRKLDAFGWDGVALIAHNALFDGSVLWERYNRKPGYWFDTNLLARWAIAMGYLPPDTTTSLFALAPLVGMSKGDTWAAVKTGGQALEDYGLDDVKITWALFRKFMAMRPPKEELDYMDMHIRCGTEPKIDLDVGLLQQAATITPQEIALGKILRKDANMEKLLWAFGVEPEYKTTPKGNRKLALAKTDAFMQGLLEHPDERVQELAEARKNAGSSITRTRSATLLRVGAPLPCPYLYYGGHVGRGAGVDGYNMQNLPKKGPIREGVKAPEGYVFVVGDSKQVEARGVAFQAGARELIETFKDSDPYRTFGGRYVYHKAPEDLTEDERFVSKSGLLGLGFGQAGKGLQASMQRQGQIVPEVICRLAVVGYRVGYPEVPRWWKRVEREVLDKGFVDLLDGRRIIYHNLRREPWSEEDPRMTTVFDRAVIFSKGPRGKMQRCRFWHGLVAENVTQGNARSLVFWQANNMRRDGIPIVGLSHDEIISIVPEEDAQEVEGTMLYWLRQTPDWARGWPVDGDVNVGKTYKEAK
jgi:hypothetical protein